MGPVLKALAPHVTPRHLIISIAAGIRLETLEAALGTDTRVVRVMPNTPCLVQVWLWGGPILDACLLE